MYAGELGCFIVRLIPFGLVGETYESLRRRREDGVDRDMGSPASSLPIKHGHFRTHTHATLPMDGSAADAEQQDVCKQTKITQHILHSFVYDLIRDT